MWGTLGHLDEYFVAVDDGGGLREPGIYSRRRLENVRLRPSALRRRARTHRDHLSERVGAASPGGPH
jgi:hypothetical protein